MSKVVSYRCWFGVVLCCWVGAMFGCSPVSEQRQRFFWPPGIDNPKIEYINFYQSDHDVRRGKKDFMTSLLLGETAPQPIFKIPFDVASDGQGRIIVSDTANKLVRVLDLPNYEVRNLRDAQGAPFQFVFPAGVTFGPDGGAFVVDKGRKAIFSFGPDENIVDKFELSGELVGPTGITYDPFSDQLYVVDTAHHDVVVCTRDGQFVRRIGQRGRGDGGFNFPLDVDVDQKGNIYVLDSLNSLIQVLDKSGRFLRSFGAFGVNPGQFRLAKGIAVGSQGHVYVTDGRSNRLTVFDTEGQLLTVIGGRSSVSSASGVHPGGFLMPGGLDVDGKESVWVVDMFNSMVHRFQYLSPEYLEVNPILPGQVYAPVFEKDLVEDRSR